MILALGDLGWLLTIPILFAFGGGGAGSPPPPPPPPSADDPATAAARSDAEAKARRLARSRRGAASTRLTDPIADLRSGPPTNPSTTDRPVRVSTLGGGTY